MRISLSDFPGFDPTGVTSSDAAMSAAIASIPSSAGGGAIVIDSSQKVRLDTSIGLQQGQQIVGEFNCHAHAGAGYSYAFEESGSAVRLHNGAEIRLDNGAALKNVLVYRGGMEFNSAPDFNEWTGVGVRLGYGNDQRLEDVMVLGFDTCVANLADRGLNGNGRVVMDRVYVDGKNGFRLVGSYDTSFFDELRAFCFATQGYPGEPAPGEWYDPRKDRRPGVGFQMLDRSDGTKIGRIETFGYLVGFDANCASWLAQQVTADYPSTPTYLAPATAIGVRLRADVDPTSGNRPVDVDPSHIGSVQVWSYGKGIVSIGRPGRMASIGSAALVNLTSDAVTIDGGGVQIDNLDACLCSGFPVAFAKAPDTVTRIRGNATQFGPSRNSWNAAVVKAPAGSIREYVDVQISTDQSTGCKFYDDGAGNHVPIYREIPSAVPVQLPPPSGKSVDDYTITGTVSFGAIHGGQGGRIVRLHFKSAVRVTAANATNGIRLPSGASSLNVPAGAIMTLDYNGAKDRWEVVSYVA